MKSGIYKRIFAIASLLVIGSISLHTEVPTWPPGGNTPAQFMGAEKLPAGRYLPDTKRWNLVWADQIVPGWVTPGKVEFAAKNYIGTQKIFANQALQFREFNPNFLIVTYHLAAGLNPEKNSDCPDPKNNTGDDFIGVVAPDGYVSEYKNHFLPWLAKNAIGVNTPKFESMFQHYDSSIIQKRVWHSDPYWLMAIYNAFWNKYICDISIEWMKGNNNEGCFFDVAVETNCSLYNPKEGNPSPRDFNWWESPHYPWGFGHLVKTREDFAKWMNSGLMSYFKNIHNAFHYGDTSYLVIPNVDQMVTTLFDPNWIDGSDGEEAVDGAMIEGFGGYTGFDMWQTLERTYRHLTKRGKIFIAQFYANDDYERLRRTGMYMLIKNETSYINILGEGNVEWYPEYEIDLGYQSSLPDNFDKLRINGEKWQSLWKRDYEKGIVLCNTSDASINYQLEGVGWKRLVTSGGGTVSDEGIPVDQQIDTLDVGSSIDVEAGNCVILYGKAPNHVKDILDKATISISPNPLETNGIIEIKYSGSFNSNVILCDVLGNMVSELYNGTITDEGSIMFNTSGLAPGTYFCRIMLGAEVYVKEICIFK